eukprot:2014031-Rhodomonas_salina.2
MTAALSRAACLARHNPQGQNGRAGCADPLHKALARHSSSGAKVAVSDGSAALCSKSSPPALQFCPFWLCLAMHAAGLRAAVMSVEMLQICAR